MARLVQEALLEQLVVETAVGVYQRSGLVVLDSDRLDQLESQETTEAIVVGRQMGGEKGTFYFSEKVECPLFLARWLE
jgi:hypothetical protein